MKVTPYLALPGRCEEAIKFYQAHLGAQVLFLHRFKDAPGKPMGPPEGVMHATLQIGDSVLHASDGGHPAFAGPMRGCSLSLAAKDATEGQHKFDALAEGGKIVMPFQKTFWAEGFGMLVDRFGVAWMVNVDH